MDPLKTPQPPQTGPISGGVPPTGPIPGVSSPNQPGLSSEEMKVNLQALMSEIEKKYQDFNSQKFATNNKNASQKSSAMRQLFQMFKSMGVDPSDPAALKQFLDQLRASNPELYQQVETALEAMLGDGPQNTQQNAGTTPTAIANDAPIDNMNIDPANALPSI